MSFVIEKDGRRVTVAESPKIAAARLAAPVIAKGFKPTALHEITREDGSVSHYRLRAKHRRTGEKWIRPMHETPEGFVLGEPAFDGLKLLYRRHLLAASPGAKVMIVEGEQKVDALENLGLLATTSGSATSAEKHDWQPLAGRPCLIWPDNDEPGQKYAADVTRILTSKGATVHVIDVAAIVLAPVEY
jgi:hypothetical protein